MKAYHSSEESTHALLNTLRAPSIVVSPSAGVPGSSSSSSSSSSLQIFVSRGNGSALTRIPAGPAFGHFFLVSPKWCFDYSATPLSTGRMMDLRKLCDFGNLDLVLGFSSRTNELRGSGCYFYVYWLTSMVSKPATQAPEASRFQTNATLYFIPGLLFFVAQSS